ncbi:alpha/beta fold hydrolase [Actinomycetospora cinnamomea]|uniref:Pimeloyl-ACP methyl ester carboxylesterase n=1 Tax=Actinomycetospora cinnamomea TaxID=663609 RepID=A0A2U1FB07_9PSEU|nr:alpha/beta hydrolase [Actinomycetospora cinnamomea]PVZ09371.1 pimeloyl-ACP methyl ester carboxylesterase [Actinomycetospora cinnamomea]
MPTDTATWRLRDRVDLPTGTIAVDVLGADRPGTPVVLTHGTPSWSYLWRRVAPTLATDRPVHVWDLPTYGDSTGAHPSVANHARTLDALVAHWELEAPVLVGHDIGAATVLRAHLVHGTPTSGLVVADAAVLPPWVTDGTQHVQDHLATYRRMPPYLFQAMVTAHFRTTVAGTLTDDVERAYLDRFAGPGGQQRYLDQVAGFTEDDTRDVVARLAEITVPVDVVWGAEDAWIPPSAADALRDAIPGARLHVVPAAGHFLTEDAPEAFLDVLAEVLP